jgi:Secretion system C-terminal sorting domain
LDQLRVFLTVIHKNFERLYKAEGHDGFAMEIEFKISAEDQLVIKQARPWSGYVAPGPAPAAVIGLTAYPNPFRDMLQVDCAAETTLLLETFNLLGQKMGSEKIDFRRSQRQMETALLSPGVYVLRGTDSAGNLYLSGKLVKN